MQSMHHASWNKASQEVDMQLRVFSRVPELMHPLPWRLAQILAGVEKPDINLRYLYTRTEQDIMDRRQRAAEYNERHQEQHRKTQMFFNQTESHRESRSFEELFDRAYSQASSNMRDPALRMSIPVRRSRRWLTAESWLLLEDLHVWHRIERFLYGCTELEEDCPKDAGWTPELSSWRLATEQSIHERWIPKVINPAELKKHPDLLRLTCASWKFFKQSLVMSMHAKAVVTARCQRITEPECMVRDLYDMAHDQRHICNNSGDSFYNDTGCPNRFLAALSDLLAFDVLRSIPQTPIALDELSPSEESL